MISLRILGSIELSREDGTEIASVLAQPKRIALLAYLAASPSAYHRRDRLLAMFWPEQDDARAREALNTAISFLRRELGREVIVSRGVDEIGLNTDACWCDAAAFRAALDARSFADASTLYRGDLLDGLFVGNAAPFEEWLERTRAQLRSEAARAARMVAEEREQSRHYTTAVSSARRAVELSADDERLVRQLLELLDRLGDRAGALAAYESFERRLAEEFSAVPSPETCALVERIRGRQSLAHARTASGDDVAPSKAPSPWSIKREIARSGMATVYLAHDTAHDRSVALKVMRPDLLSSGAERFLREIRITARLAHPRILPLIDSGMRDGAPYFVTPYVDGESLRDKLARVGSMTVSESVELTIEIAEALDYAHRSGIVHCDIKPENILLADGEQVIVADFGIARALGGDIAPSEVAGSPGYMSPEQSRGDAIDARSDLYALACVLVEAVCGTAVRDVRHAEEMLERRAAPRALSELVAQCLETERERRPPSAAVVLSRLRGIAYETAHSVSRAKRRRFAVLAGSVAAIGVLATAIWLSLPTTLIASGKLALHDTLVLADFETAGPDSISAAALTMLLRREFEDSKAIALMPPNGVNAALKRMTLKLWTPLSPKLALELAQREERRAVIVPTLVPRDAGRSITLRVIEAATGTELASVTSTAGDEERELLPALAKASDALRRRIGDSPRRAMFASSRQQRLLTTKSLAAARLMWPHRVPLTDDEKIVAARAAIGFDSTFAYAWSSIGNILLWNGHRSAASDSAFAMAYRFRDNITPMERAQVAYMYLNNVQRNRAAALRALEVELQADTTIFSVVPLNMIGLMRDTRQFKRAEAFGRRIEQWANVPSAGPTSDIVRSLIGQNKPAAADSTVAHWRSLLPPDDRRPIGMELLIALNALRFDQAEALLKSLPPNGLFNSDRASIHRLRGRLEDAHRLDDWSDSSVAASAAAAGAKFDPAPGRALTSAREALWLAHDTAAAIAALDDRWHDESPPRDIQDRINGMMAAALYAAAGQQAKASRLVTQIESGSDTVGKRALHEHRAAALGEIALADKRFSDAMRLFRESDVGADGLPATPCAVCILPALARVAETAGWTDSARVFWEDYVTRPAIERLESDQWFLATAYGRLAALGSKHGDAATAAYRDALLRLQSAQNSRTTSSHH